jgi:hypothetical protein
MFSNSGSIMFGVLVMTVFSYFVMRLGGRIFFWTGAVILLITLVVFIVAFFEEMRHRK